MKIILVPSSLTLDPVTPVPSDCTFNILFAVPVIFVCAPISLKACAAVLLLIVPLLFTKYVVADELYAGIEPTFNVPDNFILPDTSSFSVGEV